MAPAFAQSNSPPKVGTTPMTTSPGAPSATGPGTTSTSTPTTTTTGATATTTTTTAPKTALTNINTASAAELDKLPQIGKARSAAIIKGRPYKAPDDLLTKKILSKGVFDKIKDKIAV